MKHLILGFGTNQKIKSVGIFLRSARAVHPSDTVDIGLVTNTVKGLESIINETRACVFHTPSVYSSHTNRWSKLINRGVLHGLRLGESAGLFRRAPEIVNGYRTLLETWHHPQIGRWYAYDRLLQFFHQYDRVVLSDVKDVVFQAPFFETLPDDRALLFEDGEGFATGRYNREWYVSAYGKRAYHQVAHRTPICIGVVMGRIEPMRAMVAEFATTFARAPFGRIEQAVFNRMILEGTMLSPTVTVPNYEGAVATLAGPDVMQSTRLEDGLIVRARDGYVFPIVHMYDRFPDYNRAMHAAHGHRRRTAA